MTSKNFNFMIFSSLKLLFFKVFKGCKVSSLRGNQMRPIAFLILYNDKPKVVRLRRTGIIVLSKPVSLFTELI